MNIRLNGIFFYTVTGLFIASCLNQLTGYLSVKNKVECNLNILETTKFYNLKSKRYKIDWDSQDVNLNLKLDSEIYKFMKSIFIKINYFEKFYDLHFFLEMDFTYNLYTRKSMQYFNFLKIFNIYKMKHK